MIETERKVLSDMLEEILDAVQTAQVLLSGMSTKPPQYDIQSHFEAENIWREWLRLRKYDIEKDLQSSLDL